MNLSHSGSHVYRLQLAISSATDSFRWASSYHILSSPLAVIDANIVCRSPPRIVATTSVIFSWLIDSPNNIELKMLRSFILIAGF